jgi:hypothetical protein
VGKISVYQPAAGKNIWRNPSTEIDTNFWNITNGSTITADLAHSSRGCRSLKAVCVSNANGSGVAQSTVTGLALAAATYVTVQADVFVGAGECNCVLAIHNTDASWTTGGTTRLTAGSAFQQWSTTLQVAAGKTGDCIMVTFKNDNNSSGDIFWIDGLDGSTGPTGDIDSYIDGDQRGCAWTGIPHASTSTRSSQYRGGGILRDIDSYCGVRTVALLGFGPMTHTILERPYSTIPGGLVDGYHLETRDIAIVLTYKAANLAGAHAIRKGLNALFLPGRVYPSEQPIRVRYSGGSVPVEFDAYYTGGLEGAMEGKSGNIERIAITLRCPDPFFDEAISLIGQKTASNVQTTMNSFVGKVGGSWANVATLTPTSARVNTAVPTSDGWIIGGSFTTLSGVTNATNIAKISAAGVVSAIGTGCAGEVFGIKLVPGVANVAIVFGAFTSANAVAHTLGIAKLDLTALTFTAVAGGVKDGVVNDIAFDRFNNFYAVGTFTAAETSAGVDVSFTKYIAFLNYSPNTWGAIHNGTVNANGGNGPYATCVCNISATTIWIGGYFANVSGTTCSNLVAYNYISQTFSNPGSIAPANGRPNSIAVAVNGDVTVGGIFITSIGGVACYNIAAKVGTTWQGLMPGFNDTVLGLYYDNYHLWAVGPFTDGGKYAVAGGLKGTAYWDGSWHNSDAAITAGDKARDTFFLGGVQYLCVNGVVTATWNASAQITITNPGTAPAFPRFYFPWVTGESVAPVVQAIYNATTGQQILLSHALASGEVLTVDLDYHGDPLKAPIAGNKRIWSNLTGDCPGDVQPGSNLATFSLVPGDNLISFFVAEDPTCATASTVIVQYQKTHDSGDV